MMSTAGPAHARAAAILTELRSQGSEARRVGMARYGVQVEDAWIKRAGFALMAGLAVHDKAARDEAFEALLPVIEHGASDGRNFVKKAVHRALRNIGKRNRALNVAADDHRARVEHDQPPAQAGAIEGLRNGLRSLRPSFHDILMR